MTVPETEKHRPEEKNKAINERDDGLWCIASRAGRSVKAVRVLESCALQVVLSPAGVEGEVGWMEDPRAGGRQSVNKQIASLLNSGRVEGRDRPRAGGMLRAKCCSCSCSTAQMLMQAVRRAGGRAGQGSLSVGPGPAPGSWQMRPWSSAAVSSPSSSGLPQQTLTLELGAFYLDDHTPTRLIGRSSINLS